MTEKQSWRWLSIALGACFGLHALALLTAALVISGGVDFTSTTALRADHIADHPLIWRVAWLPWQASAIANLAVSVALFAHLRVRATTERASLQARSWALGGIVCCVAAVIPDLTAEWIITSDLPGLAGGDFTGFSEAEREAALLSGTRANTAYVAMVWCWMQAAVLFSGGWKKNVLFVSWGGAVLFLFACMSLMNARVIGALDAVGSAPGAAWLTRFAAVAFIGFVAWLAWLAINLGREHHARHPAPDALQHHFQWPRAGIAETPASLLGEPGLRDILRPLVFKPPILRSDVSEVVYANWLVPADRLAAILPAPLKLATVTGDRAILSILTYRHGGFGPQRLGIVRERLPSPRQCNVRLYVAPEARGQGHPDTVWFMRTALDSALYVAGSRLLSDGLPAHLPAEMEHRRDGQGWWTRVAPGLGRAPDIKLRVNETQFPKVPREWEGVLGEWEDIVFRIVLMKRAIRVLPATPAGGVETAISIGFHFDEVLPAEVASFESDLLGPLVEGCPSVAFVLPTAAFRVLGEGPIQLG